MRAAGRPRRLRSPCRLISVDGWMKKASAQRGSVFVVDVFSPATFSSSRERRKKGLPSLLPIPMLTCINDAGLRWWGREKGNIGLEAFDLALFLFLHDICYSSSPDKTRFVLWAKKLLLPPPFLFSLLYSRGCCMQGRCKRHWETETKTSWAPIQPASMRKVLYQAGKARGKQTKEFPSGMQRYTNVVLCLAGISCAMHSVLQV